MITTYLKPEWDISDFYDLDYFLATHKYQPLLDKYRQSGHSEAHMTVYNYHEPSPMPKCVTGYIKLKFNFLDNIAVAINLFKPGQYLPIHTDLYGRYAEVHNVEYEKIERHILMLEDSIPGQILQISNSVYGKWKAGDCFSWKAAEAHAFYNMSMVDRYAVQLTGVRK